MEYNWFCCYGNVKEEMLHEMPEPIGKPVKSSGFFNASHSKLPTDKKICDWDQDVPQQYPNQNV